MLKQKSVGQLLSIKDILMVIICRKINPDRWLKFDSLPKREGLNDSSTSTSSDVKVQKIECAHTHSLVYTQMCMFLTQTLWKFGCNCSKVTGRTVMQAAFVSWRGIEDELCSLSLLPPLTLFLEADLLCLFLAFLLSLWSVHSSALYVREVNSLTVFLFSVLSLSFGLSVCLSLVFSSLSSIQYFMSLVEMLHCFGIY